MPKMGCKSKESQNVFWSLKLDRSPLLTDSTRPLPPSTGAVEGQQRPALLDHEACGTGRNRPLASPKPAIVGS
jgi:hypothetical protein